MSDPIKLAKLRKQNSDDIKNLGAAFGIRLAVVFYAQFHDYFFHVNFTDIDYKVFFEGASYVSQGKSPYLSPTYRYSPFLAWLLVPVVSFPDFGKILFCFADIVVGWLLLKIRRSQNAQFADSDGNIPEEFDSVSGVNALWLFNPMTIVISARGSADSLHSLAILASLYYIRTGNWILAALIHGFGAIHLRIYPIIYLPSVFLHFVYSEKIFGFKDFVQKSLKNWKGYIYAFIAVMCFIFVIFACYLLYGNFGVHQFIFYHFSRIDPKHNFSPYFLSIYLSSDNPDLLKWISTSAFVPQLATVIGFALKYAHDLEFCWFLTTLGFVSFNKVCTSQYFIWYIIFTPIIANSLQITTSQFLKLVLVWYIGQGIWLSFAYLLEFQGWNTFILIWAASILFLFINSWIMVTVIKLYRTKEQQLALIEGKSKED